MHPPLPPRPIALETWPRREHFRLFRSLDHPYFSLTVEIELTDWQRAIKAAGRPLYPALIFQEVRAANAIAEFRTRIRGEGVVEHARIHPSFTVPWRDGLFNFCTLAYEPDEASFLARCTTAMAASAAAPTLLLNGADRDDMIYLSCLPWFPITSMTHPVDRQSDDAIPRVAWGRILVRDGRAYLPLNVQLHHGLADGRHVAELLERLAAGFAAPVSP